MGSYSVKFGIDTNYFDPDYRSLYVKVIGETAVTVEGRDGSSEGDQSFIKDIVTFGVNKALTNLSSQQVSYKDLAAQAGVIKSAVEAEFAENKVTCASFNIASINPDAKSKERIEQVDQRKKMASMSPEELMKMQQEAARKAQEKWDSLSPEEKQRIQEESKRKAEEAAEQMRKAQAFAAKQDPSTSMGQAANTAAQMAALKAAAFSSPAPLKKFCSNCGAPAGLGKFCGECGKPL